MCIKKNIVWQHSQSRRMPQSVLWPLDQSQKEDKKMALSNESPRISIISVLGRAMFRITPSTKDNKLFKAVIRTSTPVFWWVLLTGRRKNVNCLEINVTNLYKTLFLFSLEHKKLYLASRSAFSWSSFSLNLINHYSGGVVSNSLANHFQYTWTW